MPRSLCVRLNHLGRKEKRKKTSQKLLLRHMYITVHMQVLKPSWQDEERNTIWSKCCVETHVCHNPYAIHVTIHMLAFRPSWQDGERRKKDQKLLLRYICVTVNMRAYKPSWQDEEKNEKIVKRFCLDGCMSGSRCVCLNHLG